MKIVAKNKQAFFNYEILDELEAGLVLLGPEIKAIRAGRATINGSYVKPFQNAAGASELWLVGSNFHVTDGDPTRTKKLLAHKTEIKRLLGKLTSGDYTIVPLELYLQRGRAKLKVALAAKRKKHDKREVLKKRDNDREMQQKLRRPN